ncbi:MAG TPA: PEP-CTERM sorting domain-containing protein, partial [Gemmatirosa sp.]
TPLQARSHLGRMEGTVMRRLNAVWKGVTCALTCALPLLVVRPAPAGAQPRPASVGPFAYVVNLAQQFGTVDLGTGAFQPIGPGTPEGDIGLVPGPNGSLLALTFSGRLATINPATGETVRRVATGLTDCTTPASPCGPTSANALARLGGAVYATDYRNRLYTLDPLTGATIRIGSTGLPAVPFIPLTTATDGSLNVFDETLFGVGSRLYATFDAITFDPATATVTSVVIAPSLYWIDPLTGGTTRIGATTLGLGATTQVDGIWYAVNDVTGQLDTLDLATGSTTVIRDLDPAVGVIFGASPAPAAVPEPASMALVAVGMAGMVVLRRRSRPS